MTPIEATKTKNEEQVQDAFMVKYNRIPPDKPVFKEGDVVRIYKYKYMFDKGYKPRWTDELFVIDQVRDTRPITYSLKDMDGESITCRFYKYELQKTPARR